MAITGIGNNYNNMYESTYAAQKNETSKKAYNVPYKVDKTRRRDFLILNTAG